MPPGKQPPIIPPVDQYERVMEPLDTRERHFVRLVLRGVSHAQAAVKCGWDDELATVRVLGRAGIVEALETLAPLLADEAASMRVLRPLLRARLVQNARGKQALAAIRDFLALDAGEPGDARAAREAAWKQRQEQRASSRVVS